MTKRYYYLVILLLMFLGVFLLLREKRFQGQLPLKSSEKISPVTRPQIDFKNLKIDGKKVLGLKQGNEQEELKTLKMANTPSPQWQENLEQTLKSQGGKELKSIAIKKVDAFIWKQDGTALNVESVIVTLKNQKDEATTFRALIDAQTGKILKNWDQPVMDSANPRDNFSIKIDPRYHND